MVTLRTPHAKNQPPRPKTVAYRRIIDRHIHRQTDTQRKQTLRTPFSIFFRFSFEGAVRQYFSSNAELVQAGYFGVTLYLSSTAQEAIPLKTSIDTVFNSSLRLAAFCRCVVELLQ